MRNGFPSRPVFRIVINKKAIAVLFKIQKCDRTTITVHKVRYINIKAPDKSGDRTKTYSCFRALIDTAIAPSFPLVAIADVPQLGPYDLTVIIES